MSDKLVAVVREIAQGRFPPGRIAFIWTVHEGIRGSTELQVFGDGAVTEGRFPMGGAQPVGRVDLAEVQELAATLDRCRFHEIRSLAVPRPGATIVTLDVQAAGEGVRVEFPSSDSSRPEIAPISAAFQRARARATVPPAPIAPPPSVPPAAGNDPNPTLVREPRVVQLSGKYWTMMGCMAPFTFGLTLFIGWWSARSFPRLYDDEGVTTRSGRRYGWGELSPVPIVNANRPGVVLGYHLAAANGSLVRLAPFSFVDGRVVCEELLARAERKG